MSKRPNDSPQIEANRKLRSTRSTPKYDETSDSSFKSERPLQKTPSKSSKATPANNAQSSKDITSRSTRSTKSFDMNATPTRASAKIVAKVASATSQRSTRISAIAKARERREESENESESDDSGSEQSESEEEESVEEESEKEELIVERRSSRKSTPKRTPARKQTILTPQRSTPKQKGGLTCSPFPTLPMNLDSPIRGGLAARDRFHATARPPSLPCREDEYSEIIEALENAIDSADGACIYISGVPGTGKTATVHSIIEKLMQLQESGDLKPFDYLEINGMKLSDPIQSYSLLWERLSGEKNVPPKRASSLLDKYFAKPQPKTRPCVVLVDELDQFVTRNQKVIYNFFDWPNRKGSKLIVIAIANTMDLPERVMLNRVSSRLGLTRLNFAPYNYTQLIKIVQSRLVGTDLFKPEAIELCAKKVGSVSGDARRALEICRYAISLVENAQKMQNQKAAANNTAPMPMLKVDVQVVLRAVKELNASPAISALQGASLHQLYILASIVKQVRMTGLSEVDFEDVIYEHLRICSAKGVEAPAISDIQSLALTINQYGWIILESKKPGLSKKVRLCIMEEDIITIIQRSKDQDLNGLFT